MSLGKNINKFLDKNKNINISVFTMQKTMMAMNMMMLEKSRWSW